MSVGALEVWELFQLARRGGGGSEEEPIGNFSFRKEGGNTLGGGIAKPLKTRTAAWKRLIRQWGGTTTN